MFPNPQPSESAIYEPCSPSHYVTTPINIRYGVAAITSRFHRGDPGSTPGIGASFFALFKEVVLVAGLHWIVRQSSPNAISVRFWYQQQLGKQQCGWYTVFD